MLVIQEHSSDKYAPRTYFNAKQADLTLAVAANFYTGGERCTAKAAGDNILKVKIPCPGGLIEQSRRLYKACTYRDVKVLNIAGNGIYTFSKQGIGQKDINKIMYDLLSIVHLHYPIQKIVTGGQTGSDLAGAVVAHNLGIPCTVTLPKGFLMRFEDGVDVQMSESEIRTMIEDYSRLI